MRKKLSILLAIVAWITVALQYYLILENRIASIAETTIRFLSFFTILTNSLVAIYFTAWPLNPQKGIFSSIRKPGILTALTVYITVVGLVYQLILRPIWAPTGLQMIVDELLHSIIPVLVIIFWYVYETKPLVKYAQIATWILYPLVYLVFILIRGHFSDYYPYPFVDVNSLGLASVLLNSAGLVIFFIGISALFIKTGKVIGSR